MGFPIIYDNEADRLAAIRHSKNNYASKPFTCSLCSVTILLGNKHNHKKSKKHRINASPYVQLNASPYVQTS